MALTEARGSPGPASGRAVCRRLQGCWGLGHGDRACVHVCQKTGSSRPQPRGSLSQTLREGVTESPGLVGLGECRGEAEPRGHGEGGQFLTRAQCRRAGRGGAAVHRSSAGRRAECRARGLRCPRGVQAAAAFRPLPSGPRARPPLSNCPSRILLPSLCGSSISQGLFWKSWRHNDFFFN